MKNEKNKRTPEKLIYPVLLALCVLPEVIYLTRLGFYWDDWSQLFLHVKFGDSAFWDYYAYNRPLSAWTDILYFPICGESPIRWHILLLLLKFILCAVFYRILSMMLPRDRKLSAAAALLFAVCPLFSQIYISIAYTQHFTDFILFGLSVLFLLLVYTAESKFRKFLFYTLSVVCTILHLTITEYFAFLELLKFPLLCCMGLTVCHEAGSDASHIKNIVFGALKYSSFHILLFAAYCVYRLNISRFFPTFGAETPDLLYLLLSSPLSGIRALLKNLAVDVLYPFTGFISRLFAFDLQAILSKNELIMILFSAAISAAVFVYLSKQVEHSGSSSGPTLIIIGVTGILLGVLPFLVMNENFLSGDDPAHADRTFLAAMPFVCLIYACLLGRFFPSAKLYRTAVCIFIFLFCRSQMAEFLDAVQFTGEQNDFYRQLSQRIPGIEDGTAIVDDTIIFPDQGNFSTASAVNVLYPNPIRENGDIPLWIFSYPQRPREKQSAFHVQNRIYHMSEPPSNYIYIDYDNQFSDCVWILGPEDTDNPHLTDLQRGWVSGSNLSRIIPDGEIHPDRRIFGEPKNDWCDCYQKASLMLQTENWEALSELTKNVLNAGYTPSDERSDSPFEWWPFIASLIHDGDTDTAYSLAAEGVRMDAAYEDFFTKRFGQ